MMEQNIYDKWQPAMKDYGISHFTLYEMSKTNFQVRNLPTDADVRHLIRLMQILEKIRAAWGAPIVINQGFRSQALSEAMRKAGYKPAPNSAHQRGDAADLGCKDAQEAIELASAILKSTVVDGWEFDQLLMEHRGRSVWIHLGLADFGQVPRMMVRIMTG